MTFRWGILGTGTVARKFVLGLRQLPGVEATSVASGRRENATGFARDFAIPGVADDVEELAESPEIDAVYIATPPGLHRIHAVSCLERGKAVLIEKPFAATSADARAIIEAARLHGVFCMEGMWTRFLPLIADLRARIAMGEIGELRSFSGSFATPATPDPAQSLFRPDLGGGALLHRGIYPLSLACHLMGPPTAQYSLATLGKIGVDEDSLLILRHEGGAVSAISSGLRSTLPNDFVISGTEGSIHVAAPIYRPFRMIITRESARPSSRQDGGRLEALKESGMAQGVYQRLSGFAALIRGRRRRSVARPYAGNGYHYEAAELMARVRAGELESPIMPLDESLRLVTIMEAARESWATAADKSPDAAPEATP
jgi:predicted dehydrogenase